jgi:hypothetical protein
MQIIQSKPSSATLRQAALDDALGQIIGGMGAMDQQAKTKRAEALALQDQTRKLREAGYDVTEEQVAKSIQPEQSGFQKLLAGTPIGKSLGYDQVTEKVDLYGKRTPEWIAKNQRDQEDKDLDREYKRSLIAGNYSESQRKMYEHQDMISGNKFKREVGQGQAKALNDTNAKVFAVKSGIDQALAQLDNPNLSDEEKLKVGQETLKLLNSAEGADAVGAEEAQRLGSKLEFAMGNFFNGNPTQFGRDIPGFADQLRNNSQRLAGRIKSNEDAANLAMSGQSLSSIANGNMPNNNQNKVSLNPLDFRGQNPSIQFNPTNIPNVSPVNNAYAAKAVPAVNHPQSNSALNWAKNNPNDPRAAEIIRRLGGR